MERTHAETHDEQVQPRPAEGETPAHPGPIAMALGGWASSGGSATRGSQAAVRSAIARLQGSAGNLAVARLLAGRSVLRHQAGPARIDPGRTAVAPPPAPVAGPATPAPATRAAAGPTAVSRLAIAPAEASAPVAQRADGEEAAPTFGGEEAVPTGGGPPTPGPSWTHIGPPSNSSFAVSGTLRQVATTLAARTEAGATTTNSDLATETWEPPNGVEKITAARFTVAQKVELPTWSDKGAATKNQQAEWDRFSAAITAHENGHVATDKTSYANAHTKILGKTPSDGNTKWGELDTQAKTDNDAFDAANDHGRNAGTNINANIDEVTKVP